MWPDLIVLTSYISNRKIPLSVNIATRPNPFSVLCNRLDPFINPENGMIYSGSQDKAIHIACRIQNKYKYSSLELPQILKCTENSSVTQYEFEKFLTNNTYKNMLMIATPRKITSIFHIFIQTFSLQTIIKLDHTKFKPDEVLVIDVKNKSISFINENDHTQSLL